MLCTEDGLCFIQPILAQGVDIGHATATQVGTAAYTLLQTCVIERGMGGLALDIGESKPVRFRAGFSPGLWKISRHVRQENLTFRRQR